MSGHSKWATIKRKKSATDQKRGVLFSKLSKNITLAIKQAGPDPETNAKLRLAIKDAKQNSMPSDNIDRAIDKAKNAGEGNDIEELLYEAYGPGGSAILIEIATDNRNRSISEVKTALTKNDAKLGESGSAAHLFQKFGEIIIETKNYGDKNKDDIILELMDVGADDVEDSEEGIIAYFPLDKFTNAVSKLDGMGIQNNASVMYKPFQTLTLEEKRKATLEKLIDSLEDLDDVNKVYSNAE